MTSKKIDPVLHIAGVLVAALFFCPILLAVSGALQPIGVPPTTHWLPSSLHWENFGVLFTVVPMSRYLFNSILVVGIAVPLTVWVAASAGFAIARLNRPWRYRLVMLNLILLLIPGEAVWMFRYQIYGVLGILDTPLALMAPALAGSSPLFVLLYYWAFSRESPAIFEAAMLDGATVWQVWRLIAMPLSRATTVAVAILAAVFYWSDFIGPVLYVFKPQYYTLPVGLQLLKQMDATNIPLLMAGAVLMMLPVIILFVVLQRYFLSSLGSKS